MEYKSFRSSELVNPTNWGKLLKLTPEEVLALEQEWIETEKYNKDVRIYKDGHFKEALNELTAVLDKHGIKYKFSKSFFSKSKKKYENWFEKVVVQLGVLNKYCYHNFPYAHMNSAEVEGIKISNNCSPTTIMELYRNLSNQLKRGKETKLKVDKHLSECYRRAVEMNIEISDLTPEEVRDKVEEILKENFLKDNYPPGTEVSIDYNHCECETYTIGAHRCSCGNRRMSVWVEGNCLNGYYLASEPH